MSIYIWIQSAHHVGHIQIDERIYSTRIVYNEKKSFTCQILRKSQLYTAINVNEHFTFGIVIIIIGGFLFIAIHEHWENIIPLRFYRSGIS